MLYVNDQSPLVRALINTLGQDRFTLIDVGASGGVAQLWDQLGSNLQAYGFDPLTAEVDRLNAAETSGRTRYFAAFVTCRDQHVLDGLETAGLPDTNSFERTSARRAARATQIDYNREHFNRGTPVHYTDQRITIDEFSVENSIHNVDFIKTDTDGHDYYALQGSRRDIVQRGVLGVQVECPLHGTTHPHANTFANIDRYLRELGFALFDMNVWRYTRAALPGQFYYALPAATTTGQVQWCDALYFLDPITRPALFTEMAAPRFAKLLMLYDIFGLPDCAAELIVELRGRKLEIPGVQYGQLLDLLTPGGNYNSYVSRFDKNPSSILPSISMDPWLGCTATQTVRHRAIAHAGRTYRGRGYRFHCNNKLRTALMTAL